MDPDLTEIVRFIRFCYRMLKQEAPKLQPLFDILEAEFPWLEFFPN